MFVSLCPLKTNNICCFSESVNLRIQLSELRSVALYTVTLQYTNTYLVFFHF